MKNLCLCFCKAKAILYRLLGRKNLIKIEGLLCDYSLQLPVSHSHAHGTDGPITHVHPDKAI